jgi:capsule polysaccharide export protein KpsE/RkpR
MKNFIGDVLGQVNTEMARITEKHEQEVQSLHKQIRECSENQDLDRFRRELDDTRKNTVEKAQEQLEEFMAPLRKQVRELEEEATKRPKVDHGEIASLKTELERVQRQMETLYASCQEMHPMIETLDEEKEKMGTQMKQLKEQLREKDIIIQKKSAQLRSLIELDA